MDLSSDHFNSSLQAKALILQQLSYAGIQAQNVTFLQYLCQCSNCMMIRVFQEGALAVRNQAQSSELSANHHIQRARKSS